MPVGSLRMWKCGVKSRVTVFSLVKVVQPYRDYSDRIAEDKPNPGILESMQEHWA